MAVVVLARPSLVISMADVFQTMQIMKIVKKKISMILICSGMMKLMLLSFSSPFPCQLALWQPCTIKKVR